MFRSTNFGYTRIHANASQLTLQYVDDQRGAVHDVVTLSPRVA